MTLFLIDEFSSSTLYAKQSIIADYDREVLSGGVKAWMKLDY